jgi:DNA polymerase III subunit epsilon
MAARLMEALMDGKIIERDTLDVMAATLEATGDYRILRRFVAPSAYATPTPPGVRRGLIVDTETTGLDVTSDKIIELGLVPFEFDSAGTIYGVDPALNWFEDPGMPIPAEAQQITGITDDMVRGQRIDDDAVVRELARAHLVIAHNASFDRRILERRLPAFADRYWACSLQEVPWARFDCRGSKLEYILFRTCSAFHTGHRAGDDCLATLHVLATPRDGEVSPMRLLLENARRTTVRLSALGTPIETKDLLKRRGYRWCGGTPTRPKTWYRDLFEEQLEAEQQWLREHAYGGLANPPWAVERFTARDRYSDRVIW